MKSPGLCLQPGLSVFLCEGFATTSGWRQADFTAAAVRVSALAVPRSICCPAVIEDATDLIDNRPHHQSNTALTTARINVPSD